MSYGAVVTSDREIQEHAERSGLAAISSHEFERRMETALAGDIEISSIDEDEEEEIAPAKRKGSAWQLSKKEKKRRAILEKL